MRRLLAQMILGRRMQPWHGAFSLTWFERLRFRLVARVLGKETFMPDDVWP